MLPLFFRLCVFARLYARKCISSLVLALVFVSAASYQHVVAAQTWSNAGGAYAWSSDPWSEQQGQDDITIPWDDNWGEDELNIPWLGEEHDYGDGSEGEGQQWPWSQLEPYGDDSFGSDSHSDDDYGDEESADSGHERAEGYGQHRDGGNDAEDWVQYKRTMPRSGAF